MSVADQNWVARLAAESGPTLVRFLGRRMSNPAEAEDLAQEVYLRLMRVGDADAIRDPRSFALRVAANVAYEWRMAARNRFPHSDEPIEFEDERQGPYREVLQSQEMKRLSGALRRMSPVQRAIVLLHRRDGMTYREIAQFVGISVQMVNKHLAKGIALCKDVLGDAPAGPKGERSQR